MDSWNPAFLAPLSQLNITQVVIKLREDWNVWFLPITICIDILPRFSRLTHLQLFRAHTCLKIICQVRALKSLELLEVELERKTLERKARPNSEDRPSLERLALYHTRDQQQYHGISQWFNLSNLKQFSTFIDHDTSRLEGNDYEELLEEVATVAQGSLNEVSFWNGIDSYIGETIEILKVCKVLEHVTLFWSQMPFLLLEEGDDRVEPCFPPYQIDSDWVPLSMFTGEVAVDWSKLPSLKTVSVMFAWHPGGLTGEADWEYWWDAFARDEIYQPPHETAPFDTSTNLPDEKRVEFKFGFVTTEERVTELPQFPDIRRGVSTLLNSGGRGRIVPTQVVPRLEWPYYFFSWGLSPEEMYTGRSCPGITMPPM